jgi:hypothetical protein
MGMADGMFISFLNLPAEVLNIFQSGLPGKHQPANAFLSINLKKISPLEDAENY